MTSSLAGFRERIPEVKPWIAVAIILAVVLVLYYVFMGVRFYFGSQDLAAADLEINSLTTQMEDPVPTEKNLQEIVDGRAELFERWAGVFIYEGHPTTTDPLLAIISDIAIQSGVNLGTMKVLAPGGTTVEEVRYRTQPVTITAFGRSHSDIFRFLSNLHSALPFFRTGAISLAGFTDTPSAEVRLTFYLAPVPDPEEAPTPVPTPVGEDG